jgi:hypothetical protein
MYTTKNHLGYYSSVYLTIMMFMHISYALIFIGLIQYKIELINYIHYGIQIFICLFLIARFHPFREHSLSKLDVNIIFSSAIILLTNIGITGLFIQYFSDTAIGKVVTKNIDNIITKLPIKELREKSPILL